MAHAENEVTINKPISQVFTFLTEGTNDTKWRSGVVSIALQSGQSGQLGARYKQILKGPGGRNIDGDYELTTVTPNKELSFRVVAGPARPTGTYLFSATGNATRLKFILDYQPRGLAKLMAPMIQKTMDHEVAQLAQLKQVLEG